MPFTKNWQGIVIMPWFNDMQVWSGIREIAKTCKLRPASVILTAVQTEYKKQTKCDLNVTNVFEMHKQLRKAGQDIKTRADHVADYIEVCCSRYVSEYYKSCMPIERG